MSKKAKLIAQILANPANVRYDDACADQLIRAIEQLHEETEE